MATPLPTNSAPFTLEELRVAANGTIVSPASRALAGIVTDSRWVRPGTIFVALRGAKYDGHEFIGAAIAAGAGAVVVERDQGTLRNVGVLLVRNTLDALGRFASAHRARFQGPLIAVTGSVGKTTTKELIAEGLTELGLRVHRTSGNLNNRIGLPMTLLALTEEHQAAVVEMGMSVPGEIAKLAQIAQPTVGVVTSIAEAHLEGLGSIEAIGAEKNSLLLALPANGVAVASADDVLAQEGLRSTPAATRISFGRNPEADVVLTRTTASEHGTHCEFHARASGLTIATDLKLVGKGPALSATAALATILAVNGHEQARDSVKGFARLLPGEGRARPLRGPSGSLLIDDAYNASPRSCELALRTAAKLAAQRNGQAVAVLGDMLELGDASERLHEELGAMAVSAGISMLVCCGPLMRAAARGALTASLTTGASGIRIESVDDALEAVELVRATVEQSDVILVKGSRGARMERAVAALREDVAGGQP